MIIIAVFLQFFCQSRASDLRFYDFRGWLGPLAACEHLSWHGALASRWGRGLGLCQCLSMHNVICVHIISLVWSAERQSGDIRQAAGLCSLLMICDSPQILSDVTVPASYWSVRVTWPAHWPLIGQIPLCQCPDRQDIGLTCSQKSSDVVDYRQPGFRQFVKCMFQNRIFIWKVDVLLMYCIYLVIGIVSHSSESPHINWIGGHIWDRFNKSFLR